MSPMRSHFKQSCNLGKNLCDTYVSVIVKNEGWRGWVANKSVA